MSQESPDWASAIEAIQRARKIVVFTGAGVSSESGIPTFRDDDGFWTKFPPEEFAHWQGILRNTLVSPKLMCEFLLSVLEPIASAEPNAAHLAIAQLEQFTPVTVVTQNIDGLHQRAGSTRVQEIHGTLFDIVRFPSGEPLRTITRDDLRQVIGDLRFAHDAGWTSARLLLAVQPLLGFDPRGFHRPHLVLFGDAMAEPAWSEAQAATGDCDCLIAVGTSGQVYPAASLPDTARERGVPVISIDPVTAGAGIWLPGTAVEVVPKLLGSAWL